MKLPPLPSPMPIPADDLFALATIARAYGDHPVASILYALASAQLSEDDSVGRLAEHVGLWVRQELERLEVGAVIKVAAAVADAIADDPATRFLDN